MDGSNNTVISNKTYRKSIRISQLIVTCTLATAVLYCLVGRGQNSSNAIKETLIQRPVRRLPTDLLTDPPTDWLLDLPNFTYLRNHPNVCVSDGEMFFIVVVHSKPDHFRQRQVIRKTWSNHPEIRTVFLLGMTSSDYYSTSSSLDTAETTEENTSQISRPNILTTKSWKSNPIYAMDIESLLDAEDAKYGDLIQGNFMDHYRNLTYKNVMGLKWISDYCYQAKYVLKTDDDAFVDVFQLKKFLIRTFDTHPRDILVCNVLPNGSSVYREGKWAVTHEQYPWSTYPTFCGGLAYIMTPDLGRKLLQSSMYVPFLWIDDVYVTGLLAEAVYARHFYLNLRYTYHQQDFIQWLQSDQQRPFPYIIGELDTKQSDWRSLAEQIWNKTMKNVRDT